ncbi:OmpA family protein [Steroidobacter sp.]|uniref:OmpA family protein n=1 Tax=Steroidobacter sp. TaxID=1978227 RepID=UPI001A4821BD|nr:OmpA family protein [Steroidobacter sp.]MBL8269667.1 OmpA family protein [Steroidobacter sp.]
MCGRVFAVLLWFVVTGALADEAPKIALVEGLTITTAIAESDGDYESIKRIVARQEESWLLSYSASLPSAGSSRVVAGERILHDADLLSARTYRNQFENGVEEDYPGTTALGASMLVLDELKRGGKASFSLVGEERWMTRARSGDLPELQMAQALMANRNLKYQGELRALPVESMTVLVNGRVAKLPVVRAAGQFSTRKVSALDAEFAFLDGTVPIALQWRIGQASLRVVRIDYPVKKPDLARELAENKRVVIPGLHFDFGSAVLRQESNAALPAIVDALRSTPGAFRLAGHTDNIGDEGKNQSLSQARAQAVRAALIKLDPSLESRLTSQGFGESQPVASNSTLEGRAQNRRVELVAISW